MSGPKGGSYQVETAAQREARMLRDAKADYARARCDCDTAEAILSAARTVCGEELKFATPPGVPAHADSAAYVRASADLRAAATAATELAGQARERAAAGIHADRITRMVEHLAAAPTPSRQPARKAGTTPASAVPESNPETDIDQDAVRQRVGRRLKVLASLDHDAARVAGLIDDIETAGSQSRIELILSELNYVIADARQAAARVEQIRASRGALAALQARIADVRNAVADDLRRRIDALIAAETDAVPPDLAGMVDAVISAADAETDRLLVVHAMATALEQLGYHVGPEFSTDLSGAQGIAYARSGLSGYGVKVRLEADSARFTAQAVKSDSMLTSADEDTTAEREFCTAFNRMIELASHDGVELHADIRAEPGTYAVQQVADSKLGAAAATHKARAAGARQTSAREMGQQR